MRNTVRNHNLGHFGSIKSIRSDLDNAVSPFTNGPGEAEFPKDLVFCSPQERSGDQMALAKVFADAAGIGYEECMFQFEDAQAVGQAVGRNPVSILVPCHRILGANNTLTGYGGGLWRKEFLLQLENISYRNL